MKPMNRLAIVLAVVTGCVTVAQATLLTNGSFEFPEIPPATEPTPTSWGFFTSGPDSSGVVEDAGVALTGDQFLQFFAPGGSTDTGAFQGYFQSVALNLTPAADVEYTAWLRSSPGLPMQPGVTAKLGIEFKILGVETNRVELLLSSADLSTSVWRQFKVVGSPIDNIDEVVFTIVQVKDVDTADAGIFFVEDAFGIVAPEPGVVGLLAVGGCLIAAVRRRNA